MLQLFALLAVSSLFASAKPVPAQDNNEGSKSTKFLIAGPNYVRTAEFNGNAINLNDIFEEEDKSFKPTWIVPSKIGFLISNANSGALIDVGYAKESNKMTVGGTSYRGSIGVSHMTYNKDSTRLLAATGLGLDIWDSSASDGSLKLLGSVSEDELYTTHVVADPSGSIYVVGDRKSNSLMIMSAVDDNNTKNLGMVVIEESCGPIRGAFYAADGQKPTRYFALCQSTKEILSFGVDFSTGSFKLLQRLQTSVDTDGDKRSVADLLIQTNSDRSANIYVFSFQRK